MGFDHGAERLEERNLLSATSTMAPIADVANVADPSSAVEAAPAEARKAAPLTFDSPFGPVTLTIHNKGTKFRGVATIALTPGPNVPNIDLSPVRFKGQIQNLQLESRFTGKFQLPLVGGPKQRFTGTLTAAPNFLNPTQVPAHVTVKVARNVVADQDFTIPLSTLLALAQQGQP